MTGNIPIQQLLNYPVIPESECEVLWLFNVKELCIGKVLVSKQDGVWISGYEFKIANSSEVFLKRSMTCCRKWGEYDTRIKAIVATINKILEGLIWYRVGMVNGRMDVAPFIRLLQMKKRQVEKPQLNLFE